MAAYQASGHLAQRDFFGLVRRIAHGAPDSPSLRALIRMSTIYALALHQLRHLANAIA